MAFAPKPTDSSRRHFLKVGIVGTAVLATVGITASVVGFKRTSQQPLAENFHFLRNDDLTLLTAVMPAVLGATLTTDAAARAQTISDMLSRIDSALVRLTAPNQKQVRQLFDLLNFAPTRYLAAGVGSAWDQVSQGDAGAFLQRWRDSRIGLFNAAYRMLTKVTTSTYFALPVSFQQSGYPGPWAPMYDAVNS